VATDTSLFAGYSLHGTNTAVPGDYNRDGKTDIALTAFGGWTTVPVALSGGSGSFGVTRGGWPAGDFAFFAADRLPSPTPTTTTPPGPQTKQVTLHRQQVTQGPIPYVGKYPELGVAPPGRLLQIRLPQVGLSDTAVLIVKAGRSTQECNSSDAVVRLHEGQTTTPAQITAIYGTAQPTFSTLMPLFVVACVAHNGPLLHWVNIEITVL
jgi:hypothetical protein